jgi:hypothetical protein
MVERKVELTIITFFLVQDGRAYRKGQQDGVYPKRSMSGAC